MITEINTDVSPFDELAFEWPEEGIYSLKSGTHILTRECPMGHFVCAFPSEADAYYYRDFTGFKLGATNILCDKKPMLESLGRLRELAKRDGLHGVALFAAPDISPTHILYTCSESEAKR